MTEITYMGNFCKFSKPEFNIVKGIGYIFCAIYFSNANQICIFV